MKSVMAMALLVVVVLAILSLAQHGLTASTQADTLEQKPSANVPPNDSNLTDQKSAPPRGAIAPDIVSDTWLNSAPLSSADLRGKVVLVEFWTFDCINCQNAMPHIRALYQKYRDQGFVVIGVHSPELAFEHDLGNVKTAIKEQNIPYPIAIDNDFKNWNAFKVQAWPTWFILDKQGAIRFAHIGEGAYVESDQTVAALLKE